MAVRVHAHYRLAGAALSHPLGVRRVACHQGPFARATDSSVQPRGGALAQAPKSPLAAAKIGLYTRRHSYSMRCERL